jgi:hypothetical protein
VMDINLKKEMVLDGVGLALLPTAPALLIVEGGSVSRGVAAGKQGVKKGLVSTVIDTLREGGNVLIPCESAGRALELIQMLGTINIFASKIFTVDPYLSEQQSRVEIYKVLYFTICNLSALATDTDHHMNNCNCLQYSCHTNTLSAPPVREALGGEQAGHVSLGVLVTHGLQHTGVCEVTAGASLEFSHAIVS